MQILIFGWVFVSFLQGVTGFGVPIAIGAPLLIGIGVSPLWSVFILLVGGAWANTFGTLGVAWEALLLQINSDGNPELLVHSAFWAALFIWIVNFLAGIIICWIYGKKEGLLKGLPAVVIISLVQGGGQLFLSVLEPSLAVFIPTTLAMFASFLLGKSKWYRDEWSIADSQVMDRTEGENQQKKGLFE